MIVITGAAGFIGSCMTALLNEQGITELLLVDDFSREDKNKNLDGKKFVDKCDREAFWNWLEENEKPIEAIIHLGARTDTTEMDTSIFDHLNLDYSKRLWNYCCSNNVPLVYASSAATYGGGEHDYQDNHDTINQLVPLNPYGQSKQDFDVWVLAQEKTPPFWAGLKFFNVYGPNEFHKSRMASVIFHAFHQIKENGFVNLFRSHREDIKDGEQMRDFVYVKDVSSVIDFLLKERPASAIYNLGSGTARPFNDLAKSVFAALDKEVDIRYIDTPADIRDKYQYFTEADMNKLKAAGYQKEFTSLEDGTRDYVANYLSTGDYF